jgi:hypothetical protein
VALPGPLLEFAMGVPEFCDAAKSTKALKNARFVAQ